MRHQHTCIDFVEVAPANDTNPIPLPPGAHRVDPGAVIHRIPPDWTLPDDLRVDAKTAGVADPDAHLERLKAGPVGGARGIFADQLHSYLRGMFGKWRTWEETDRAKAAQKGSGAAPPPPVPSPERMKGWPAWVRKSVAERVTAEGRDVRALAKLFARTHHIPPQNLDLPVAAQAFEQFLERVRKEAA